MNFTDAQSWLLIKLAVAPRQSLAELPLFEGMDRYTMEMECLGLIKRKLITIDGPPNQNAPTGQDIEAVFLTALGVGIASKVRANSLRKL